MKNGIMFGYIIAIILLVNSLIFCSDFVVAIKNNAYVYITPDIKAASLTKLSIGQNIIILSNTRTPIRIDNCDGYWVYIDTQQYNIENDITIKGWVPSIYIASKSEFKKVNKFNLYKFDGWYGDSRLDFVFNNDGTAIQTVYDEHGNIIELVKGRIYQKESIILIEGKARKNTYYDYFYFDEKGDLLSVFLDENDHPMKVKRLK